MMRGVVEVPFGDVRVVARPFMIASLMVFSGGAMVFGGVRGAPLPRDDGLLLLRTRASLL